MPSSSWVKKGVRSMSAVRALREKLGDDGMAALHIVINDAGRQWKDDVLTVAGAQFQRQLAGEIGALRVDIAKEFAAVRVEMATECAAVRREVAVGLAETHASLLKWSFLFWVGQVAAMTAMMAFLLKTIGPG
jgi:hypothetical protein